jgi:hypothetical protein
VPQPGTPDEPIPGVPDTPSGPGNPGGPGIPDSPIVTTSFQTVITVVPTPNQPTVVTTYITFLTPRPPTPTPTTNSVTFGGSTLTLVPDTPVTAAAKLADVKPRAKMAKREEVAKKVEDEKRNIVAQQALGPPTPTKLEQGQYWIRAVAAPHFHEYIQTKPQNEAGPALLGNYKSAGQYNVVGGQLVSTVSGTPFYMHVEKPADFTQRKLATWFNTTKNEFGTFAFSGDALTWTAPEVKRQNNAAWLCCANNELFINTGAYAYQTPAGCADQTVSSKLTDVKGEKLANTSSQIHYYNDATANA